MSYAEFSAKKVAAACTAALNDKKNWIKEEREKRIAELMTKPRWGFFGPLRTREQAISYMKRSGPPETSVMSEWDEIDHQGFFHYTRISELRALAEVAPRGTDSVMLSADDAYKLKDYLK